MFKRLIISTDKVIMSLDILPSYLILDTDINGRTIKAFCLNNVQIVESLYYPGVKLFSDNKKYNPIREQIMSLPDIINCSDIVESKLISNIENCPVFFFIYNVDNYYHFLYDTLPYLITFRHLKKTIPELKLITNFANEQQAAFNKFVLEFLDLLDIKQSDIIIAKHDTLYSSVYISSSYTHDGMSNIPPRQEVYQLYTELVNKVANTETPKKIYVSRRAHKHGIYDNIGTNYTSRRSLVNEDELVSFLESQGYVEVFTELLSTSDKISLFKNCTHVVGAIGGGLCNVLFSRPETKLTAIMSPYFMKINSRFNYSFANVQARYFTDTEHVEKSFYKKYMRVRLKSTNIIGEIEAVGEKLYVSYSTNQVAGWNAQTKYQQVLVSPTEVDVIDNGLNSAWKMNINTFKKEFLNVE